MIAAHVLVLTTVPHRLHGSASAADVEVLRNGDSASHFVPAGGASTQRSHVQVMKACATRRDKVGGKASTANHLNVRSGSRAMQPVGEISLKKDLRRNEAGFTIVY